MHIKDFKHVQMIPTTQFSPAFVNNASKQNLKKNTNSGSRSHNRGGCGYYFTLNLTKWPWKKYMNNVNCCTLKKNSKPKYIP